MSMSLAVRSHRRGDESYLERLNKLVPAEVLAPLVLVRTALGADGWPGWWTIAAAAGATLVPVILYWDAARAAALVPGAQYVVRTLVFVAWSAALSGRSTCRGRPRNPRRCTRCGRCPPGGARSAS